MVRRCFDADKLTYRGRWVGALIVVSEWIRRNLTLAPKETKVAAYKALARPQLEYAASIWNPHHQKEINRLEKVRRTAAPGPVDAGVTRVTMEKC